MPHIHHTLDNYHANMGRKDAVAMKASPFDDFGIAVCVWRRLRKENADLRQEVRRLKARCGDITAEDGEPT